MQVAEVIAVDTAAPDGLPRPGSDQRRAEPSVQEVGTVKWYNAQKSYGFILRDGGGKDIFVHASALQRSGMTGLKEGQRVVVDYAELRKGPEAVSIRPI
jgi:CspA family cold shock protein